MTSFENVEDRQFLVVTDAFAGTNEQPRRKRPKTFIESSLIVFTLFAGAISAALGYSKGGLTRGSGMTEKMHNPCILSAHVTSKYNSAMQDFTDLAYTTSPQHKDSTEACIKRDGSDLDTIQTKNTTCSPYIAGPTLRNIVNGIVAGLLLFQRFLVLSKSGYIPPEDVLPCELSPHPPALFEAKNKPQIIQARNGVERNGDDIREF
ncbi:hypothetical protein DPMN_073064 [Dreissena polymorpha]|uniref:Uncharacterized protein n=1 Tax=Dreissena polymorpha TaxID=45954 RepID=A0A9D4HCH8_DREPO|nr:hypothetical protein DPMN_073064 [Dreissena polymorpha]